MEVLQKTFITLTLTLVFVLFAVAPLQDSIETLIESNARLQLQKIVSTLNLMQTAPVGTTHDIDLPEGDCKLKIDDTIVKLTIKRIDKTNDFIMDLIQTPITVDEFELDFGDCQGTIHLERIDNEIRISKF